MTDRVDCTGADGEPRDDRPDVDSATRADASDCVLESVGVSTSTARAVDELTEEVSGTTISLGAVELPRCDRVRSVERNRVHVASLRRAAQSNESLHRRPARTEDRLEHHENPTLGHIVLQ